MRPQVVTLFLLASLSAPAHADRALLTQTSQRDFDAAGLRVLRVENPRGVTRVEPSADGRVHLVAHKLVRASGADRERLARDTQVEAGREGDAIAVRVRYPQGPALRITFFELFSGLETPRVQVEITVQVPSGLEVDLRSSSGDLQTRGLAGTQRLATTSGDILVEEASGTVTANATSGDIEASGLALARIRSASGDIGVSGATRTLVINTTSGNIQVDGARDSLRIESVSGDIDLDGAAGPVTLGTTSGEVQARGVVGPLVASTSSGDLDLGTTPGFSRAEVSSVSGDVTLDVPRTFAGAVELQTSSGTLEVSLPVQVRSVTRRALRGTIGSGNGRLLLKSASGDLHVTSGGQGS